MRNTKWKLYLIFLAEKKSDKNFKPNMKQFPPLNMFFSYLSVCVEFEFWVESPWVLTRHSRNERANNFQSISVLFSSVHSMSFIEFYVLKLHDKNKDLIAVRVNSFQSISVLFLSVRCMSFMEFLALKLHDEN